MGHLDININFDENIPEDILNIKLKDMFCKHVIRNNAGNTGDKANSLYRESCKIGYNVCNWGLHVGHDGDVQYHVNTIVKMEKDGYEPVVRIVVCKYTFCETSVFWIDNLHSAIKYVRQYGKNVKLKDIPFYIVDISDYEHPYISGYKGSLRESYEDILGAVSCAYERFRNSNSKRIIEIRYTLEDFLCDNPVLYTRLNMHLGLINASDDVGMILDKCSAFNSLYDVGECLYGQK